MRLLPFRRPQPEPKLEAGQSLVELKMTFPSGEVIHRRFVSNEATLNLSRPAIPDFGSHDWARFLPGMVTTLTLTATIDKELPA